MTVQELTKYAAKHETPYFTPATDIEVYDEGEEKWKPLVETKHSFNTLLSLFDATPARRRDIRFTTNEVEAYLHHIKETGIDDDLHHDQRMNRTRLVSLADEGYTSPEDLTGRDDMFDIERETGVDRDILQKIAAKGLDGFGSAASLRDTTGLTELEPNDSFTGWELSEVSETRIQWVSEGRFNLKIKETPNGNYTVETNTPDADKTPWYTKGHSVEVEESEAQSAKAALEYAEEWLAANQIDVEESLVELPGVGEARRDALVLDYSISTRDALKSFAEEQPEEFNEMFGSRAEELRDEFTNTD